MVLIDDDRVLDQRLERLDPALDERLLVLGVLVLGVLGQVAVFLGVVDPLRDLWAANRDELLVLLAEVLEPLAADVGRLVVHVESRPRIRKEPQPAAVGPGAGVRGRRGRLTRVPEGVKERSGNGSDAWSTGPEAESKPRRRVPPGFAVDRAGTLVP